MPSEPNLEQANAEKEERMRHPVHSTPNAIRIQELQKQMVQDMSELRRLVATMKATSSTCNISELQKMLEQTRTRCEANMQQMKNLQDCNQHHKHATIVSPPGCCPHSSDCPGSDSKLSTTGVSVPVGAVRSSANISRKAEVITTRHEEKGHKEETHGVRWSKDLRTVHHIMPLTKADLVGADWVQTRDLCSNFWGGEPERGTHRTILDWPAFMKQVELIAQPDFCCVGQMWRDVAGGHKSAKRPGELPAKSPACQHASHVNVGQAVQVLDQVSMEWRTARVVRCYSGHDIEISYFDDCNGGGKQSGDGVSSLVTTTEVMNLIKHKGRLRVANENEDDPMKVLPTEEPLAMRW